MIENINLNTGASLPFICSKYFHLLHMKCIFRKQNSPYYITGHINFLQDNPDSVSSVGGGVTEGRWDTCWVTFDTRTCVLTVWEDEQEVNMVQRMDTTPATFLYDLEPGGHFKIW